MDKDEKPRRGGGRPVGSTIIKGNYKLGSMRISDDLHNFLIEEAVRRSLTSLSETARQVLVDAMNAKRMKR